MRDRPTISHDDADRRFADRLRVLVETMPGPEGGPYTPKEIADGTGLSQHYVRALLRGGVAMPAGERVQRLAAFFGVDTGYFFARSGPSERRSEETIDAELRRMLDDPWLIKVARRSAGMGQAQKEALLQMIDAAHELVEAEKLASRAEGPDDGAAVRVRHDEERRRGEDRRREDDLGVFSGRVGATDAETTEQ